MKYMKWSFIKFSFPGFTYFFNGEEYWQFKDSRMQVRSGYPQPIGSKWLDCDGFVLGRTDQSHDGTSAAHRIQFCLVSLVVIFISFVFLD